MNLKLEHYKYDMARCTRCKGCVWVDHIYMPGIEFSQRCPSLACHLFDAYSAYGRLRLAEALLEGRIDYSPTLLDVIYKCTLGGACDAGCKRNLDLEPLLVLEALRAKCVQDRGPLPEHERIANNIEGWHNRFGSSENRTKWIPDRVKVSEEAEIIYFVGCTSSYSRQQIAKATVTLLNSLGVDFCVMGDEWCCGYLLYSTGQVEKARKQMEHNLVAIGKCQAKAVVTSCAECYKMLKVDYPKLLGRSTTDLGFRVVHLAEFVEPFFASGELGFKQRFEHKVAYHDPCNLGRLSEPWVHWEGKRGTWGCLEPPKEFRRGTYGVYESPRNILKQIPGLELIEMPRHRENAWCCGSGGGVKEAFNSFALWAAEERIKEAESIGAEVLVSCCPQCEANLQEARAKEEKPRIYDLVEILQQVI